MKKFSLFFLMIMSVVMMFAQSRRNHEEVFQFNYVYDAYRTPTFPAIGDNIRLYNFDKPLIGYNRRGTASDIQANWELLLLGKYSASNRYPGEGYSLSSLVASMANEYKCAKENIDVYELQLEGKTVCYGVVCAQDDKGIFFIGNSWSNGAGYFLSKDRCSGNINFQVGSGMNRGKGSVRREHANKPNNNPFSFGYVYDAYRTPTFPTIGDNLKLYRFDAPLIGYNKRGTKNDIIADWELINLGKYSATKSYPGQGYSLSSLVGSMAKEYECAKEDIDVYELQRNGQKVCYGIVCARDNKGIFFIGNSWPNGAGYYLSKTQCSGEINFKVSMGMRRGGEHAQRPKEAFGYVYDAYRTPTFPTIGDNIRLYNFDTPLVGYNRRGTDRDIKAKWDLINLGKYSASKSYPGEGYSLSSLVGSMASEYKCAKEDIDVYELQREGKTVCYGIVCARDSKGIFFIGNSWPDGAGYFLSKTPCSGEINFKVSLGMQRGGNRPNGNGNLPRRPMRTGSTLRTR